MADLLPIFPLELVLFPGTPLPLHIFEDRYKEMVGECLEQKIAFGIVPASTAALKASNCSGDSRFRSKSGSTSASFGTEPSFPSFNGGSCARSWTEERI